MRIDENDILTEEQQQIVLEEARLKKRLKKLDEDIGQKQLQYNTFQQKETPQLADEMERLYARESKQQTLSVWQVSVRPRLCLR